MDNELYHYGIKGMKWGVRRASKKLSKATTAESHQKAVASLEKHKTKGGKQLTKLEKEHVQLQKDVDRRIQKDDLKVKNLRAKAARKRAKAVGFFVSEDKADQLIYQANKLTLKADKIQAYSEEAKAKMYANEHLSQMFREELSNIDRILVEDGRRFING